MLCDKCHKPIGDEAYEVRKGYVESDDFIPETDIGHYCSDCLSKGV